MSRRIPCSNSSVKIPRCGSECLKAIQIPTKGISVHCALPPPLPPSPRSRLRHYRTPGTRRPREVALRSWPRALCPPLWCGNHSRGTTTSTSSTWGLGGGAAWAPSQFLRATWALLRAGAASHQVTPLPAAPGLPAGTGLCKESGVLLLRENRNDAMEASAAEHLTWSRKGEFMDVLVSIQNVLLIPT